MELEEKLYSITDIVPYTGLTRKHLMRKNGPIERVLKTYYWRDDLSPDNGQNLTEEGLDKLLDYVNNCGNNGDMTYADWQQKIWDDNGVGVPTTEEVETTPIFNENTANTVLVTIPEVDITPSQNIVNASFDALNQNQQSFKDTLAQVKAQKYLEGQQLAAEVMQPMLEGFNETQRQIFTIKLKIFGTHFWNRWSKNTKTNKNV